MNEDVEMQAQKLAKKALARVKGPAARQPLPSSGISFDGQLKMLRAYVNASEGGAKPVSLDRLAGVTRVSRFTASSCNRFFEASNFIVRGKTGFKPTEGLISFVKQLPWNEERAKSFLRDMVEDTWYKKELQVLFGTNPSMSKEDLVLALGSSVGARPDQKTSLDTLVKFVIYAGLLTEDAETGKLGLAGEALPSEAEVSFQEAVPALEEKRIKMGGVPTTFSVNLNLTLDITSGSPDEHVKKIKEILEGLGEEEKS